MSYPAYEAFADEIDAGYAAWRVYMHLRPPRLHFVRPREVKIKGLAIELHMGAQHVRRAIHRLIAMGYLEQHGHNRRGVRSLTVCHDVQRPTPPAGAHPERAEYPEHPEHDT